MSRELDAKVAGAEGFEVVGLVPAYRDPERGGWCVGQWDDDLQPAFVQHCDCDIRDSLIIEGDEDSPWLAQSYKGHMLCCLEVVPFYSADLTDAWYLVEHMHKQGYWCQMRTPFGKGEESDGYWAGFTPYLTSGWNGIPDNWRCGDSMPQAICRAFLAAKEAECPT